MLEQIYQFRIGETAGDRWAFHAEHKNKAFRPVVYRFRQSLADKRVWRFAVRPPQMELYPEQVLHQYLHRGRRLQQEQTEIDFAFLNRRLFREKIEQQFSFCDREMQRADESYLFSFLLREMDDSALVLLFSFLVREMGEAAKVQDFSFLLRKAAVPETTTDFSFLVRKMLTEDELVNFSFIIRNVLQEKTAEWLVKQARWVKHDQTQRQLQKISDLSIITERGLWALLAANKKLQLEKTEAQERKEAEALTWCEFAVQGWREVDLEETAVAEKAGKAVVISADKLVKRNIRRPGKLEKGENCMETVKHLSWSGGDLLFSWQHSLHSKDGVNDPVLGIQHKQYDKMVQTTLDKHTREAMTERLDHLPTRVILRYLFRERGQHFIHRRVYKRLGMETEPIWMQRQAENALYLEWMLCLSLAHEITAAAEEGLLSKEQQLTAEVAGSLAARMMQELQYIAENWMVIRTKQVCWTLEYIKQLRRDVVYDMLQMDGESCLRKYAQKSVRSKWEPVMAERQATKKLKRVSQEKKLRLQQPRELKETCSIYQTEIDHEAQAAAVAAEMGDEKQSVAEGEHQYGKTDFLQWEQPGITAETEHFTVDEAHLIAGRNPDQLNFEQDRNAELIQRFWTIAKSGFTDRIVLPDVDYPYRDKPIESGTEIKHNENWDSVFPNQFYRRIDRHPVQPGTDMGKDETDVDIAVMVDMINIFILVWFKYVRAFWGWTGSQAVLGIVSSIYEYMNLETTRSDMRSKGTEADYERVSRWIRWEAEAMVLKAKDDMELRGNYYVGLLLEELIAYMENHHFDVVPIFQDVNKMDEWRTLFGRELETDITWVLDKVKGIRHRKLGG